MNDAVSIGDQLTVVNEGKIVQTGSVQDMLDSTDPFIHDFFYEVYQDAELLKNYQMTK